MPQRSRCQAHSEGEAGTACLNQTTLTACYVFWNFAVRGGSVLACNEILSACNKTQDVSSAASSSPGVTLVWWSEAAPVPGPRPQSSRKEDVNREHSITIS